MFVIYHHFLNNSSIFCSYDTYDEYLTQPNLPLLLLGLRFPNLHPVKPFASAGCKIMQHYVTNLYNIMQRYVIRGDISPYFRRLIAVNDRFCCDNLIGI